MHPALNAGLAGMRRNVLPGMVLWAVGAGLLAAYYGWPAARPFYDAARHAKEHWGYGFSALAGALSGGLVPFLVLWASGRIARGERVATLLFLTLFWVYRGVEVDAFYRLQGWLFGDDPGVRTVALKTAVDMLLYSALWTIPTTTLIYFWFHDCGRDWASFCSGLSRSMFTVRIPALVFSCWAVWAPTVCIVYSLPAALQIPVFNVVLCFWVLLVSAVTEKPKR